VLPVVEAAGHEHPGRGRVIKPEQHPPVGKQVGPEPGPAAGGRQLQPGRETGVGGQPLQEHHGRFGLGVGRADRVDEGPVAPTPHLAGVEAAVGPDQRVDTAVMAVGLGGAWAGREGEDQLRIHQRQLPQGAKLVPAGRGQVDGVGARVPQPQVRPGQAGQLS
jgi:hypothetical protein